MLGLHGVASSPFFGQPADANGYMNRLACVQNYSAVSGVCLMVRRELFDQLGGLDGETFSTGLSDADLCLRMRDHGYLIVWTPFAVVAKATSQTVALDEQHKDSFYERWLPRVANDPAYNHNLSLRMASFNLEPGLREDGCRSSSRCCLLSWPCQSTPLRSDTIASASRSGAGTGRLDTGTVELCAAEHGGA